AKRQPMSGAAQPCPNPMDCKPATRHQNRIDRLKPFEQRIRSALAGPIRAPRRCTAKGASPVWLKKPLQQSRVVYVQNEANFSQFTQWLARSKFKQAVDPRTQPCERCSLRSP